MDSSSKNSFKLTILSRLQASLNFGSLGHAKDLDDSEEEDKG
jgi:hypothetical protein